MKWLLWRLTALLISGVYQNGNATKPKWADGRTTSASRQPNTRILRQTLTKGRCVVYLWWKAWARESPAHHKSGTASHSSPCLRPLQATKGDGLGVATDEGERHGRRWENAGWREGWVGKVLEPVTQTLFYATTACVLSSQNWILEFLGAWVVAERSHDREMKEMYHLSCKLWEIISVEKRRDWLRADKMLDKMSGQTYGSSVTGEVTHNRRTCNVGPAGRRPGVLRCAQHRHVHLRAFSFVSRWRRRWL